MLVGNLADLYKPTLDVVRGGGFFNIFFLILVCVFILQLKTLILQYILLLSILFLDRPDKGIYFTTFLFFVYNYKLFFQTNLLKYTTISLIIVSLALFIINDLFSSNEYFYLASWVISMIMIGVSIFCVIKVNKVNEVVPEVIPVPEVGGKIDIKKIDINFHK